MTTLPFKKYLLRTTIGLAVLLSACGGLSPATEAPTAVPVEPTAEAPTEAAPPTEAATAPPEATAAPAGPVFALDGAALNRDAAQAGQSPAVALGTLTAGSPATLWVTWAENA